MGEPVPFSDKVREILETFVEQTDDDAETPEGYARSVLADEMQLALDNGGTDDGIDRWLAAIVKVATDLQTKLSA